MSRDTASRFSCSPRTSVTFCASRAVATTACPASRAAVAMSTPMPRAAPVMNQTFMPLIFSASRLTGFQSSPAPTAEAVPLYPGNARDPLSRRRSPTFDGMDSSNEMREFLVSRRARLTPEQAGLPNFGGRRRVAGMRREEVALIAGISVEYYTRLERGNASGMSESVLEGVSRALQLDEAEHAHLHNLARASATTSRRPAPSRARPVTPGLQQFLDAMKDVPAIVQNGRLDIVATNRLGAALYFELYADPHRPLNF